MQPDYSSARHVDGPSRLFSGCRNEVREGLLSCHPSRFRTLAYLPPTSWVCLPAFRRSRPSSGLSRVGSRLLLGDALGSVGFECL